jgi:hypothetical protein
MNIKQIQISLTNLSLFGRRISLILQMIKSIDVEDMVMAFKMIKDPHALAYLKVTAPIQTVDTLHDFQKEDVELMITILEKFKEIQQLLKLYNKNYEPSI